MLLKKGAEANIYLRTEWGRKVIVKKRIKKKYRLKEIDLELRSSRTAHEAQLIHEAKKAGVPTPAIYGVDKRDAVIIMDYLEGRRLKELLFEVSPQDRRQLCYIIGQTIARLHRWNIIHGDLTTSNMIMVDKDKIHLIDFGLSYFSDKIEDKGVDLHLIKRALDSTHFMFFESCFKEIKRGYSSIIGKGLAGTVYKKVNEIERRGRYSERM
ncbi:KEOPS complex kinase/ATPase Bud32 [[Eubacterium] cellulosolvens]